MRIGFLVDATCDLPDHYYSSGQVLVMPIGIRIGEQMLTDERNAEVTTGFLDSDATGDASQAETSAFDAEQIRALFLERLVLEYDYVFCLTVTRERSQIHENATQASFGILNDYHSVREAAGMTTPFSLRVIDTGSVFAGQGIPVLAGLAMREAGEQPPLIRARVADVANRTHAYAVLPDLYYLRNRARKKGEKSVGLVGAMLGSALDLKPILHANQGQTRPVAKVRGFEAAIGKLFAETARAIREGGLLVPAVNLSYGGPLQRVHDFPGYAELAQACQDNGIELLESLMSLTGIINLGPGALTLAYARADAPRLS
ncbi:MAG: DegV family protein [Pseudoxanthomonas suwonensis]|nr:DegV family protein [Pseudoxanthomonas suwonensis]